MLRAALLWASRNAWLESQIRTRRFARRAVRRFLPGETLGDALDAAKTLADNEIQCVLTQLGENVTDDAEADAVVDHYTRVLERSREAGLDGQISVKLTQLGVRQDAARARDRLLRIVDRATALDRFVWIDMEESDLVDPTLDILAAARARSPQVGVCLQAYLYRTVQDLERLKTPPTRVRLVKGAYREPRDIALQGGAEIDARYVELASRMLDDPEWVDAAPPVFGTHDVPLIERVARGRERSAVEVHMLYGIRTDEQLRLVGAGHPVRVLISYGEAWYPWYVRRLAERPANLLALVRNLVG